MSSEPANGGNGADDADRADESQLPAAPLEWPPGRPLLDDEAVAASCPSCSRTWRVHRSLAAYRLRCVCDAWVEVPATQPVPRATELPAALAPRSVLTRPDASGLVRVRADTGEIVRKELPTSLPLAPGSLEQGNVATRARWTNRALFEIGGAMLAILGPQVAALLLAQGREAVMLLPVASLVSCVLVVVFGLASGPYAALALRRPSLGDCALAIGLATGCFAFAFGYVEVLRHIDSGLFGADLGEELLRRLGPGLAIFVVGITPAIVEEIAFRGMLQGRLQALIGRTNGLLATAMLFALCHLQPPVLPIHLGIGLAFGWLFDRSRSLWPCMLMHCAYNSAVLLLGT